MAGLPQLDRAVTTSHARRARAVLRELLRDAEVALLDTAAMQNARRLLADKRARRALREKRRKPKR